MQLEAKAISGQQNEEQFVADALDSVKLKFVSVPEDIETGSVYPPEFVHQQFGETEKIIGYKDLEVTVLYTNPSLYLTSLIKYNEKLNGNSSIKCDDIEYKIKDCLPSIQLDAYLPMDKFRQKIVEQKKFKPFGTQIAQFQAGKDGQKQNFELYRFDKAPDDPQLEEGIKYLERAQSIAFWYIEDIIYTDETDQRYFSYFLFEKTTLPEGINFYKFAGFANLYRFYHYPDKERVRIAQMFLIPPYRKLGLGHRFLQAMYADLWANVSVYDITAETPADSFVYMRDFADCVNCAKLPKFSKENLQKGFSKEIAEAALTKFKLNKTQSRRIYEILRLFHINMNIPTECEQYKNEVLKRLKKSVIDPKKEGRKLNEVFGSDEQSLAMAMAVLDPEQQRQQLEALYENLLEEYRHILERLAKYEKDFIK